MNELQRHHYLSALGVDSYMPRWVLPGAPMSVACELPIISSSTPASTEALTPTYSATPIAQIIETPVRQDSPVNHLIGDMLEAKKPAKPVAVTAADILAQLDQKPAVVEPFSLSIWRPRDGLMVIDSRNTKLALPTELLLQNMLRATFFGQPLLLQEEVLRWPMIENSFAKRTEQDARNELQTWLSVQHEIRPLNHLMLMGDNAVRYLLDDTNDDADGCFKTATLASANLKVLVVPSLNQLLQKPLLKQSLLRALQSYFSSSQ